jgi:hypothetical protein
LLFVKKQKKEINDYSNTSGAINKHIIETYPEFDLGTKFKRKQQEYKTGKFWYDDFFEFTYKPTKGKKYCKYCDWWTNDVENFAGSYQIHLKTIHNKDVYDYVDEFPEERSYFKKLKCVDAVTCAICGKNLI